MVVPVASIVLPVVAPVTSLDWRDVLTVAAVASVDESPVALTDRAVTAEDDRRDGAVVWRQVFSVVPPVAALLASEASEDDLLVDSVACRLGLVEWSTETRVVWREASDEDPVALVEFSLVASLTREDRSAVGLVEF